MAGMGDFKESESQSELTPEEWYYQTAQSVKDQNPGWSDQQITDYMTNLINPPSVSAVAPTPPIAPQLSPEEAVQSWNDRYQNVLADISNGTPEERQQKINYYANSGELQQFRDSGLNVDNDIAYIVNSNAPKPSELPDAAPYYPGNVGEPMKPTGYEPPPSPAVDNIIAAGKRYIDTAKQDIANVQAANAAADTARSSIGLPPLPDAAGYYPGDVGQPMQSTGYQSTPQQSEAMSQAYRDIVGTPAGNIAITPYVPAPVRAIAGAAYLPNLIHDTEQSYEQNSAQTETKPLTFEEWKAAGKPAKKSQQTQVSPLNAAVKTAKDMASPIVNNITEAVTNPSQYVGEILNDPTKLWEKAFLPAAIVGQPIKSVADKVMNRVEPVPLPETKPLSFDEWKAAGKPEKQETTAAIENQEQSATVNYPNQTVESPVEISDQTQPTLITSQESVGRVKPAPDTLVAKAEDSTYTDQTGTPKQPWQMTNDEYDTARAKELAPDYKIEFTPDHKTGIEAKENPEKKLITRESGVDMQDDFTHELRHILFDKVLNDEGQKIYDANKSQAQAYLKNNRQWDYTHPDAKQWYENSQAFIDDYFKRPELLQRQLPQIYNFFKKSNLDDYAKYDVSHEAIVKKALEEGKPVPAEVLAEYPDLQQLKGGLPNETITAHQEAPQTENATYTQSPITENAHAQDTANVLNANDVNRNEPNTINSADTAIPEHNEPVGQQLNEPVKIAEQPTLPQEGNPVAPERPMSQQIAQQLFGNQQAKYQALTAAYNKTKTAFSGMRNFLSPTSASKEAKSTSLAGRQYLAEQARSRNIAEAAMHDYKNYFDKVSHTESGSFINAVEKGQVGTLDKQLQPIAKLLKDAFDDRVKQIQALGTGKLETVIDNYFPHIWKDPEQAAADFSQWFGKRPLEGSKAFTKQRTIPTTADGLKWRVYDKENNMLGSFDDQADAESLAAKTLDSRIGKPLEPVSYNPIDLTLLKLGEMDKYIMAQKWIGELKNNKLMQFSRGAAPVVNGVRWEKINDKISAVYSRGENGELILRGNYYAHPDAARIINNYLSPGLKAMPGFDLIRGFANGLNQYQLGLSAFHLGFTSYDTIVSDVALAMKQAVAGQLKDALGSITEAATLSAPVRNAMKGDTYLKEWYNPGSQGAEVTKIMDALTSGGARARMDSFYQLQGEQRMIQSLNDTVTDLKQGKYGKVGLDFLKSNINPIKLYSNIVRSVPRIVMEEVVPRQKLGIAAKMMEYELNKNPNMTHDQLREVAAKVWDSVDNRLGQLAYDNLFWNKALKDSLMLSVRSVGWNLGTWRELGGGAVDLGGTSIDAAKYGINKLRGKEAVAPEISHRTSYLIALGITTFTANAVATYLVTGKAPQTFHDLLYPLGFNPMGYSKDIADLYTRISRHGLAHGVVETAANKLNPIWEIPQEIYNNKDYWGKQVYNPKDTSLQKAAELGKYALQQITPFGQQGLLKIKQEQGDLPSTDNSYLGMAKNFVEQHVPTTAKQALPFIGITPAPNSVSKSDAELLAADINRGRFSKDTGKIQAQADTSQLESQIKRDLQSGNISSLKAAYSAGKISKGQYIYLREFKGMTPLQQQVHGMSIENALDVYNAATPEEKGQLKAIVVKELGNKINKGTPTERASAHQIRQQLFGN